MQWIIDDVTEWLKIEIPTKQKKKIWITNVYVPPVLGTIPNIAALKEDESTEDAQNGDGDSILNSVSFMEPWSERAITTQTDIPH